MKELVLILALILAVVVALLVRSTIRGLRQARAPWEVGKVITNGKAYITLRKGTNEQEFGWVNLNDDNFEIKLYELQAEAKEHAMALNMKN